MNPTKLQGLASKRVRVLFCLPRRWFRRTMEEAAALAAAAGYSGERETAMIEAIAFDAYGTLYDVYSVERKCEEEYPGSGAAMSRLWRQKQLEYSWLRTLMGRYADFWRVTEDALRYTLAELGLEGDEGKIAAIMATYLELEMYPGGHRGPWRVSARARRPSSRTATWG